MTAKLEPLIVLFDDERSFTPGFRNQAVVVRTVEEAKELFAELKTRGQKLQELWFDFVLKPGNTYEALYDFPGELLERAFYHSSAPGGRSLIEAYLEKSGFTGRLELAEQAFPNKKLFQ